MDPSSTDGRMYTQGILYIATRKKMNALGIVVLEKIFCFPMTPLGMGLYRLQGHGLQDL